MFLTLSLRAKKALKFLISLFCGAYGLHCFVCISLISDIRLSVSILSQSVDFHVSNWKSINEIKSQFCFKLKRSFLQSFNALYYDFCISKSVSRLFSEPASSSSAPVFSKYVPIVSYASSMIFGDDAVT